MNPQLNLPNYFLADLRPETTFSATMVREACQPSKAIANVISPGVRPGI